MRILLAGALYFALVFVAAFVFGAVRTFWLEPALGELNAVLLEAPLLFATIVLAARFTLQRIAVERQFMPLFGVGAFGLLLQQIAEFGLVLASGETLEQHFAYLSTPAGSVYVAVLAAFLIMPWLMADTKSAAW